MHTVLSDGGSVHEEYIQSALQKGIKEIGFTDHISLRPVSWALRADDYGTMIQSLDKIQHFLTENISVQFGIEVDYFPGREPEIADLIEKFPADYIIGSVHFLGDWNYDTDKSLYGKWSNDFLYRWYFETLKQAARSGLFDIIGHADLIKKFGIFPESNQTPLIRETIKVIKKYDLVIEVNTSGLDRPCREFYPSKTFIEICYSEGVPVTLGSDAHKFDEVGRYFKEAIAMLKNIGYKEIATFNKRDRLMIAL